ncbi:MAG: sensor domain-containing diguanylate cyclase [Candidatus Omnitrophota bacterium]
MLLYVSMSVVVYIFFRKEKSLRQINKVVFEELEENFNSLSAENQKHILQAEALNKKYYRYADLKSVVELLSSSLALPEIVQIVAAKALELVGKSEHCFFYLIDREKQELSLTAFRTKGNSFTKIKTKNGDAFDDWVVKKRQPLMVHDARKDYRFGDSVNAGGRRDFKSLISAPLMNGGKVVGVLRLDSNYTNAYLQDDLRLLAIIAHLSAVSVENAFLFQKTVELAITDGLTGLHVHRYFMERLNEEIHRAARTKSNLSLLMCDIDDFKKYNDEHGHTAGDFVLKEISGIIKDCLQAGDFASRYGGEEFAVFLPKHDRQSAVEIAEKIRQLIEKRKVDLRKGTSRVSISIGVATFPQNGVIAETLIKEADLALYKAKQEGKNKVCTVLI